MNATRLRFAIIALTMILILASSGCISTPPAPPASSPHPNATEIAPAELLGMQRMAVSTGADALQRVRGSHIGGIENVNDLAIIHYMDDDRLLTLWTTLYKNESLAESETEKMVIGIRRFGGDWESTLEEIVIDEKVVYRIAPDDKPQYFWADGVWVFYIVPHNLTPDEVVQVIEAVYTTPQV
ncbi:MAG: hypothetical protein U9N46_04645 [Euryarchaeota archaeon]|nr:MAG: hypothetical protein C5S47_07235 [ANME-2 cluster archaeon]MEA1864471.1 hypothetical protein [Euryarchaeota archaeon]